jgi:heme a synthase
MSEPSSSFDARRRAVRLWLLVVAALIFVMVLVGGATRLTESGLSIVEWQPVTGTVPPLSQAQWRAEFEKYQAIPQYKRVNRGMSLEEFKTIFWWEWGHRILGRVIGVVFLLPFLWFVWRGWIDPDVHTRPSNLQGRLWLIFGLGALQGAVGWWMVASGLAERVDVSQYRLATHLLLACLIFVAIVWTAQDLSQRQLVTAPPRVRASAAALVALVLLQLYLGALVAGSRAGLIYNTWPLIDGAFVPDLSRLFFNTPLWRNFFENTLLVQFDHRMLAYGLWVAAFLHLVDVRRTLRTGPAIVGAFAVFVALTIQASLGILTLVHQVPLPLALTHQGMAMAVLTISVLHAARFAPGYRRLTPSPMPVPDPR